VAAGQWRGAVRRTLLGAALIVYTLLFAEIFIRVFDPQPLMPRYITGTAWGVRGNIPGARYWHHTPEVDIEYRINSEGLRADREYPLAKPPGVCRIAVFGDSFFFGLEANLEDTFAAGLEARLRAAGIPVEVLNFAVGGFGTAEMLQTYEQYGTRFDPDIVIFSWDISDLNDNVRSDLFRLHDGSLERAHASYLPAVEFQDSLMRHAAYRFIADHSELYTFVRERISTLAKRRLVNDQRARLEEAENEGASGAQTDIDEEQHRNKIDLSAAILRRAHEEIAASGREFYVVDIPARVSRVEFSSPSEVLPASLRSELHLVLPEPTLARAARPDLKLYYEHGQGHFTPTGTAILVDQAVRALNGSPHLQACRAAQRPASAAPPSSVAVPPGRPQG
jgi:hypothetical protein